MRAKVAKKDMLPAIMRTVSIADRKSVVPILSDVLLEFAENKLIVKATDLDHSVIETILAEVDTFGSIAVPALTLSDIVKKSPDKSVLEFSLADKGEKLIVSSGKSKFELSTLDPKDFPEITPLKNTCSINIKSADLNKLISRTRFSMSPEENRHNLNGIFFHKEEDKLVAASTDGHRLSTSSINVDIKENIQGVIISKKTVFEVKKFLDNFDGDVAITFTANQVQFVMDEVIFISKLVDGTFPEYKRVIPEKGSDFFQVNRIGFAEIIDRIAVISEDKVRSVKLELKDGTLFFYVANNKIGNGKDEIEVITPVQQIWTAGFNAGYLMDVAQTLTGENLKIYIKESLSPILIIDEAEPESMFVIMPMRI